MILDNLPTVNEFSKHFNTRFSSLDFINNVDDLVKFLNKEDVKSFSTIRLPCEPKEFIQLDSFGYIRLLKLVINRIVFDPNMIEVLVSEMDINLVYAYTQYILIAKEDLRIEIDTSNCHFVISCQELFSNLLLSPISQLHTEVSAHLKHFNTLIDINSEYAYTINSEYASTKPFTDNLYIQSRVSTAFSYFLMAFLAEHLNIKLKL